MKTLEECRQEIDRIDREMARLFEQRMQTVAQVIEYKKSVGMPILDSAREAAVIEKNSAYIQALYPGPDGPVPGIPAEQAVRLF